MIHLGLTGWPLGHSLSPRLHAAALEAVGLEGDYQLFPIAPDDKQSLADLINNLRVANKLQGLNITIPHKQNCLLFLDQLSPAAGAIGAVNTIRSQDGQLVGENTDAPGFLADLTHFLGEERQPGRALVLGAGGSARAVVWALGQAGWQGMVAARRVEQAEALVSSLKRHSSGGAFEVAPMTPETLKRFRSGIQLIVNTTPLGMSPNIASSPWPSEIPFPPDAAVYDLVYNPRETLLVQRARAAGLRATTGLGMLVAQAALSFELWTGRVPPRDVMFEAVN